jgi:hypothetical protein
MKVSVSVKLILGRIASIGLLVVLSAQPASASEKWRDLVEAAGYAYQANRAVQAQQFGLPPLTGSKC